VRCSFTYVRLLFGPLPALSRCLYLSSSCTAFGSTTHPSPTTSTSFLPFSKTLHTVSIHILDTLKDSLFFPHVFPCRYSTIRSPLNTNHHETVLDLHTAKMPPRKTNKRKASELSGTLLPPRTFEQLLIVFQKTSKTSKTRRTRRQQPLPHPQTSRPHPAIFTTASTVSVPHN
jgi:hypothetical protein